MQGFDCNSPSVTTVETLGIMHIDKFPLLFFSRLCVSSTDKIHKILFNPNIAMMLLFGLSRCTELFRAVINTVYKYKLEGFFDSFIRTGVFPEKRLWKCIVKDTILKSAESHWIDKVTNRAELNRFHAIHNKIVPHIYWTLSYNEPLYKRNLDSL